MEVEEIESQFVSLISQLIQVFKKTDFSKIKALCIDNSHICNAVPFDTEEKIQEANNFESFINALKPVHCNWLNFSCLEIAAHKADDILGSKEATDLVTQFTENLYPKNIKEVVQKIPKITMDYYTLIKETWDKDLDDITVENLIKHREHLAFLFQVDKCALILQQIAPGIEMHWAVSTRLISQIKYNAANTAVHADIKKYGILNLKIDSEDIVIDDHCTAIDSAETSGSG